MDLHTDYSVTVIDCLESLLVAWNQQARADSNSNEMVHWRANLFLSVKYVQFQTTTHAVGKKSTFLLGPGRWLIPGRLK